MKIIKSNLPAFILFLLEAAVGLLLLINPIGFTSAIIRAIGIGMAVGGLVWTVKYFRTPVEEAASSGMLFTGLVCMLVGLFLVSKTEWLITTFTILLMIYAIVILFLGILKLQWTVDLIRMGRQKWGMSGISALIAVIFGILIIMNPFRTTEILWSLAGACLLAQTVFDIIGLFVCPRIVAEPEKKGRKEKEDEADS